MDNWPVEYEGSEPGSSLSHFPQSNKNRDNGNNGSNSLNNNNNSNNSNKGQEITSKNLSRVGQSKFPRSFESIQFIKPVNQLSSK